MTRLLKTSRNSAAKTDAPKRAGKKERTRQEIYRAAMKLFAESDYDKVTIEEICAGAGIAKATFFLHFAGKSALIGVFNEEVTHTLSERLAEHEGSAEEELLLLVSLLREAWDVNATVLHKMLSEFLDQPALVSKAAQANENVLAHVTRIVERGQKCGEFSDAFPPQVAAVALVAAWSAFTARWSQNPKMDRADINRALMELHLNGLRKKG
jgi:AcrR family transcriptional regulator